MGINLHECQVLPKQACSLFYTGNFNAKNELIRELSNAKIWLQNETTLSDHKAVSDNFGEVLFEDLTAGAYKCRITADNHQEYIGRVWIKPGITVSRDVFLEYNLVTVEWEVNEIVIQDKYEILLTATFETDVPAAVVVAEPMSITLVKNQSTKIGSEINTAFKVNRGYVGAIAGTLTGGKGGFIAGAIGGMAESNTAGGAMGGFVGGAFKPDKQIGNGWTGSLGANMLRGGLAGLIGGFVQDNMYKILMNMQDCDEELCEI